MTMILKLIFFNSHHSIMNMSILNSQPTIKLVFLDDSHIYLPTQYLLDLTDEPWFLKNLIEDIPRDTTCNTKGNNIDELHIWESKPNVISIIETLKSSKLCIREDVSLEYFKFLADKWCLPLWVNKDIEKLQHYKLTHTQKTKQHYFMQNITMQCTNCNGGYKIDNNTRTSCHCHPGHMIPNNDDKWSCCGQETLSEKCFTGYHTPYINHYQIIAKFINDIKDIKDVKEDNPL